MVVFGGVKVLKWLDGGNDGFVISSAFIKLGFIFLSLLLLLFVVIKDNAAVLGACIIALPVEGSGIV